jgi:integral membrane protein
VSTLERATAWLLPGWVAGDPGATREGALRGVERALRRYRLLAWTVGVGLLVLVAVGMPLQYGASFDGVVAVVGPLHGIIYMIYLVAAFDLARRSRFSIPQLLMMLCAGFLPVLAFVIERRVSRRVETAIAQAKATTLPAR